MNTIREICLLAGGLFCIFFAGVIFFMVILDKEKVLIDSKKDLAEYIVFTIFLVIFGAMLIFVWADVKFNILEGVI